MAWHPALSLEVRAMFRSLTPTPPWGPGTWNAVSAVRAHAVARFGSLTRATPAVRKEFTEAWLRAQRAPRPARYKKNVLARQRAVCGRCGVQGHRWCKRRDAA